MDIVKDFLDSVLIIDDREKEIIELKKSLESKDIWVSYYKPDQIKNCDPIRHRNLLFLDLSLDDSKTETEILSIYIRPILKKHFNRKRSYGIVIWSQHDDKIIEFNEKIKEDCIKNNRYTPPVFIINLDKSKYIQSGDFTNVMDDLNKKLLESPAASFFVNWVMTVENAKSAVVSDIFSLAPDYTDANKELQNILYLLARNHTGLPKSELADYSLYIDAYKSFDELLYSSLSSRKRNDILDIFIGYIPTEITDLNKKILTYSELNQKLLFDTITDTDQAYIMPGNIYEIITDNQYLVFPDKPKKAKSIAIELTPPCDFSNKKINSRLVGGILYDHPGDEEKSDKYFNKIFVGANKYVIRPIRIENTSEAQFLCFDFRCLTAVSETELKDKTKFKLIARTRNTLFADILQKFSSHSARLGLASMIPETEQE
jgi:hypothetical protein